MKPIRAAPSTFVALAGLVAPLVRELVAAAFPPLCPLCGASEARAPCAEHELPRAPAGPRCGTCAARLAPVLPDGARCAACRRRSLGVRRLVALGEYRSQLRAWVLAFKHGGREDLAAPLGHALAQRLRAVEPTEALARGAALVVPVPLHPWRRLERGYDQALLLARAVAAELSWPLERALVRVAHTPPQGALGAVSRAANVRHAFAPARRASRARLAGARVWLVDDVATSGATLAACARVLRRLGAARVDALVLGRAGAASPGGADDGADGDARAPPGGSGGLPSGG